MNFEKRKTLLEMKYKLACMDLSIEEKKECLKSPYADKHMKRWELLIQKLEIDRDLLQMDIDDFLKR